MDYAQARANMVDNQLRTNRIDHPEVLNAMNDVPRERFLPKALHGVAYADEDLSLPNGRFLIEPLAFARLLQAAEVRQDDVVLIIGCSTGYAAAVASKLAATVISMQCDQATANEVQPILDDLGADNIVMAVDPNPLAGDVQQAPFDAILVIGSIPEVPDRLIDQLGDGGRLLAIVGQGRHGQGVLATKFHGVTAQRILFNARVPDLANTESTASFVF